MPKHPFDSSTFDLAAFDLLLFDLDGTLVDSAPDITAAIDETLSARGWSAAGLERVRSWVGNGSRKLIERAVLFAANSADIELLNTVHEEFLLHYAQHNAQQRAFLPVCTNFLRTASSTIKKWPA